MPELPEVEIVRRGLTPVMAGKQIARVEQRRLDLRLPLPDRFARRLKGQRVETLERRAKYLLANLSGGDVLVMHLGMSGRFLVARHAGAPVLIGDYEDETGSDARHDHVVFHMQDGGRVVYNDPRRFGLMLLVPRAEVATHPLLSALGVEPLGRDLTPAYLAAKAVGRRSDLKAFLMDQRIVAGLGNIYVCEALFRAGLSPSRPAATLATRGGRPTRYAQAIVPVIQAVLSEAIAAGGSTLRDFRQANGAKGGYQTAHLVYDRAGEPCLRPGCRGMVRRTMQAGRSTFHCPACQR